MNIHPFTISCALHPFISGHALVDSGCTSYGFISSHFANKCDLPRIDVPCRIMHSFEGQSSQYVTQAIKGPLFAESHYQARIFLYIAELSNYDIILGRPWLRDQNVSVDHVNDTLTIGSTNTVLSNSTRDGPLSLACSEVGAVPFSFYRKKASSTIFAASLRDIESALQPKTFTDPKTKLPSELSDFLSLFDRSQASHLPEHRSWDHEINLRPNEDGKEPDLPWGPLYAMSRDELVLLRKTLLDLLDKNFIRVSQSPAAAPILFVKKPGGGLRFCVDYRKLNALTVKDRYPLPLIQETLANLSTAKHFTKLDVISAFHRIRIAQGHEHKTAFRTRFGSYEWNVVPFGLSNAPSTFQKYINHALGDVLGVYATAYVDDVLVYSGGSLKDHKQHVREVLKRLQRAQLQLDIDKCEFFTNRTKYLGFIIDANNGIEMDETKIRAVQEWSPPTTVKGIQSFLGFVNFYRQFIPRFTEIARPLQRWVHKESPRQFELDSDGLSAFEQLKAAVTSGPVLAPFNPECKTVLSTDASGYASGACLSQWVEGRLRPCSFFSQKHEPAELNYDVYDKELLAIIKALRHWDAELRSVEKFTILTDHRNLSFFKKPQLLSDRHIRWQQQLSRYNFDLQYKPGQDNVVADALSRRPQDQPDTVDETYRKTMTLLPATMFVENTILAPTLTTSAGSVPANLPNEVTPNPAHNLWSEAFTADETFPQLVDTLRQGLPKFPPHLGVRAQVSECSLINDELFYRGRRWVPEYEPLRTHLIQTIHDSIINGHAGRERTAALLKRLYFWPGLDADVRQFCRNCLTCGRVKAWHSRAHGLLKPLPVPQRIWQELSVDYITDLPLCQTFRHILVFTDRLSKAVIFEPVRTLEVDELVDAFERRVFGEHGFPHAIVSDRGRQFVSLFWTAFCRKLKIKQRLSTAHHPQTDGSTERANQTLEQYIRVFSSFRDKDWVRWLPAAQLSLNNHDNASTGVSPFFAQHGYHCPIETEPIDFSPEATQLSLDGEILASRHRDMTDHLQTFMTQAQARYESIANRHREPAPDYKIGDQVWLDLRNIPLDFDSCKFGSRNAIYRITNKVNSHAYTIDIQGVHPTFHVSMLRPVPNDPLPSQIQHPELPLRVSDPPAGRQVQQILQHRLKTGRGRGGPQKDEFLVKWQHFLTPTWTQRSSLDPTLVSSFFQAHPDIVDAVTFNRRRARQRRA